MEKIKIHCSWDLDFELYHEKQIELFVDFHEFEQRMQDSIKILIIIEPPEIIPKFIEETIKNQEIFDFILSHNEDILINCKNSSLFEFGGCWIKQPYIFTEKKFEVSTLVGGRKVAEGHLLREKLWYKQEQIKIPKNFLLSGNYSGDIQNFIDAKTLGDKKEPLFDSQFHIVIENIKRKNWFTEKLIDSMQTKTVPIYYGCPNINDYFNIKGMFIVDSLREIIEICNGLNESTYESMKIFIEENFEKSKKFCNIAERIKNKTEILINGI